MNSLDPRSLIAMGGLMALVMGIVLGFTRRYYPPNIHGLGHWAMAPAAMLGAAVFFGMPAPAYPELWRWVANGCIVMVFVLFHVGFRRFFGKPARWRCIMIFYVLTMLLMAWYAGPDPSYRVRVAIATTAIGAVHIASLVFLLRYGNRNFPVRMVQVTLALHLCVLFARLLTVLTEPKIGNLLEASTVQTYYLGAYVLSSLLLSLGALLMATDRVRTELEHIATHDGLTGTLNRRAILACCEDEHERSTRYGQPFSLMMIDLDHFKAINDTHGHQHGDRVLVHFADCTRTALRSADRLGRYGGEEFLVLLPNTTTAAALVVAERMREAQNTGHALACTASIGVTEWRGPEDTLDTMLARADTALYKAKALGRNQVCTG